MLSYSINTPKHVSSLSCLQARPCLSFFPSFRQGVIWKKPGSASFDIPAFVKAAEGGSKDAASASATGTASDDAVTQAGHIAGMEQSVLAVLTENEELVGMLGGKKEEWTIREVGDGNINFVFIVTGSKGTLVVKKVRGGGQNGKCELVGFKPTVCELSMKGCGRWSPVTLGSSLTRQ